MTKLLMKIFLPKGAAPTAQSTRAAAGQLSGVVGILCNALLFGAKLLVGLLSGAVSVIADGMNNLSDAGSSLVTFIGFKLAATPADEDHPYGHARYEYLSGLGVAALILVIGFELAKTSVEKIIHPAPVEMSPLLVVVLVGSMLAKLWLCLFNRALSKHIDSAALMATAADSRNDVIATAAVLVAALVEAFTDLRVDGFVGLAVAIFILSSGVSLGKQTISPLLGESASPELQRDIVQLLKAEDAVLGFHDLMVHDYGPGQRFGSLHVEMDQSLDPLWCHELIDNLERKALDTLGVHLVIHYDPVVLGDEEMDSLKALLNEALAAFDPRLSLHDFRMVRGAGHSNLIFDIALPFDMTGQEKAVKKALENALAVSRQGTYYLVITFDKGLSFGM